MWKKGFGNELDGYTIVSNLYIVQMTGGSVIIKDKGTGNILKRFKELNYVYTGDIKPDESECFALENGKHFFVYSLKRYELIKRVTLPRFYEAIDRYGFYSEDGKVLNIPVNRWISEAHENEGYYNKGHYEYAICKYETQQYTLVEKEIVNQEDIYKYHWLYSEE